MALISYRGNSQYLTVTLQDGKTKQPINGASVVATMTDSTGAVVTQINALTLPSIDSNGTYEVEIQGGGFAPDPEKAPYALNIVATTGGGKRYDIVRDVLVPKKRVN